MKNKLQIFSFFILLLFYKNVNAQCNNFVFAAPTVTKANCTATSTTGSITSTVTAGSPEKWELLNASTLAVLQTINSTATTITFNNVAAGNYKVKVSSATCNLQLTQDIVVGFNKSFASPSFNFYSNQTYAYGGTCGTETDIISINYGDNDASNGIVYPVTVELTVHMPNGSTQIVTQTYNTQPAPVGNTNTVDSSGQIQFVKIEIPLVKNSVYSYDIKMTDGCGNVKTRVNQPVNTNSTAWATASTTSASCPTAFPITIYAIDFKYLGNVKAKIISYNGSTTASSVGTTINLTQTLTFPTQYCCLNNGDGRFNGTFSALPVGTYEIQVYDDCGNTYTLTYNHNPVLTYYSSIGNFAGCGLGTSDLVSMTNQEFINGQDTYKYVPWSNAQITAAPAGSGLALPKDVSNYISTSSPTILTIDGSVFPVAGTYTIQATNVCGFVITKTVTIGQYLPTYITKVITGCNIFSVNINYTNITNSLYNGRSTPMTNLHTFALQYYNPLTGKWEHPTTSSFTPSYAPYIVDGGNSVILINGATSQSFAKSGKYRIVDVYTTNNRVYPYENCLVVAKEFTVNFNIDFTYYAVKCADGSYTLAASASGGNGNFTFSLYDATHATLVAQNTTGIFPNIANGDYKLDITDTCPNSLLNQPITIPSSATPLVITATGDPCTVGSAVTLSVPNLSGVTYRWFKTANPSTTISTTNEYNLTANPPSTSVSYSVQITYSADPTNCINTTLTYSVGSCVCYDNPNTTSVGIDTKHGITLLRRAGAERDNWPMVRKSAHTALESNTKGFVITRMTSDPAQLSAVNHISKITNPVEGMMVYDTFSKCLKIYADGTWSCFSSPACP